MRQVIIWIIVILAIVLGALAYWQWKNLGVLVEVPRELTVAERQAIIAKIQIPPPAKELTSQERQQLIDSIEIPPIPR